MKLAYLTAKTYPSTTADHAYVRFLAYAFSRTWDGPFELIVRKREGNELDGIPVRQTYAPRRLRTWWYFLWIPWYCLRHSKEGIVFFSNDLNLLCVAIFWKRILPVSIYIVSDWHELSEVWKDAFVACRSSLCICTTQQLAQNLAHATGTRKHIEVIYGGVDMGPFSLPLARRSDLGLPEDKVLIGYVGYFTTHGYEKGLFTLIEAMQYMDADVHLVLVGAKGREIEDYVSYAEQRIPGRCHVIPAQPFAHAIAYQKAMDILVIPYPDEPHFRKYGFPMKTYEYIAAGKPIIYSNLPILAEVLADIGIPFNPGDAKDLARALAAGRTVNPTSLSDKNYYSWDAKAARISRTIVDCI